MASYATAAQYRVIYDTSLSDERLQALLDKASREIASELARASIDYDTSSEDYQALVADVVIDMVHRAAPSGDEGASSFVPFGATQYSESANGFSESFSLGNPFGDIYARKSDLKKLGIIASRIGWHSMASEDTSEADGS